MNIFFVLIEPEDCINQCTDEEGLVCGDDGVTYHNECLLKHSACINGLKIKIDHQGPCPLMDNDEDEKNIQSDAFDTEGDDDDDDNSNEDKEILRDGEGKNLVNILGLEYNYYKTR